MKKLLLIFSVLASFTSDLFSQNVNVTLSDQLSYGNTGLSNLWEWKDPQDGKEYALVGAANGLSIVDVSNPANVFQVTLISGPNCTWREIRTNGNYAYVTTECGSVGLQIVNLTNLPGTNLQTATWTPTIGGTQLNTIHALQIDNGKIYLYGSNVGNKGAIIADIATNPMAPVYLGSYDNRYIHDGYVRNDTLYACHIYDGDCEIVNVANPAAGVPIGDFQTPNSFTHNSWLSENSKICFTTDEVNNSYLGSFDVSNLNNITELDRIQSNPGSNSVVHNTHIVKKNGVDFAVTSWYRDGFTIVDCSHPANLVQVGNYDTAPTQSGGGMNNDWGVDPFLPSGTIIASDISNGLFVCSPTYVRACFLEGTIMDCNTGNPLAGAKIQLMNPPAKNVNSATDITDALGKYGVGVLTAGTYTVTVSRQAYVSKTFTVSVTTGNTTTLNTNLCPQTPPFTYSGHVYENFGTSIQGAMVHIQDSSLIWDTITDANGNFTIPGMLNGNYTMVVGHWGHITKCFSSQSITATSSTPNIGLDKGIYDDFSFDFGWVVSGSCGNAWERGIPIGTIDNGNGNAVANPGADVPNDCEANAYVTDNAGGSAADHDVDPPGYTILTSPGFNPSSFADAYVSYYRWFYNAKLNGNNPNDTMTVSISNGSTQAVLESIKNNTNGNGTWVHKIYKISSFIAPSSNMKLILKISDANPGSVVEGGLDKFFVYDSAVVAVNEDLAADRVLAYPNPFSSATEILLPDLKQSDASFVLYSIYGNEVRRMKVESQSFKLDREDLPGGIYFYKIISSDGILYSGKLMIE